MKLRFWLSGLFFISFFLLCLWKSVSAQITFQKHYGFGNEIGYKIIEADNGYIICGSYNFANSSDIMVTKTDYSGNVIWSKLYGGIWYDDAYSMDNTHDGGYILAGYTSSYGGIIPNDYDCALLLKIDSVGNMIWSQILEFGGIDAAYGVKETYDHGFIVTGTSTFGEMFLVKTDSSGIIEWSNLYGTANVYSDMGRAVIQKRDSSYAVLGMSDDLVTPDTAAVLYIVSPSGSTMYAHYYQVMNSSVSDDVTYAYDLFQNEEGDLLIAGGSGGNFQNLFYAYSPFVLKTDSVGNYLGGKIYSLNTGDGKAYSIKEQPGGGYIIGGTMGNYYPLLIETDSNLNSNWCYYYGNFSNPPVNNGGYGFDAIRVSDGGYALTGYRAYTNPGIFMTLVKTDSAGQSGCNQGIPAFGGSSSNFIYNYFQGTVFSISNALQMAVTLNDSSLVLPDSTLCTSTSIEELTSLPFTFYPNPANEILHIDFLAGKTSDYYAEIRDISGKVVMSELLLSENTNIDISKLPQGLYVLKVNNRNNTSWITKFVRML